MNSVSSRSNHQVGGSSWDPLTVAQPARPGGGRDHDRQRRPYGRARRRAEVTWVGRPRELHEHAEVVGDVHARGGRAATDDVGHARRPPHRIYIDAVDASLEWP